MAGVGHSSTPGRLGELPLAVGSRQRWVELLKDGQIVTVTPAEMETALRDLHRRPDPVDDFRSRGGGGGVVGHCRIRRFRARREWGEAERDSLRAVADMLGASIARHRVQTALVEAKETLEQRVLERTSELQEQIEAKDRAHAELAAAQQRLIELSREAGMAEIATGVLHNVGNV